MSTRVRPHWWLVSGGHAEPHWCPDEPCPTCDLAKALDETRRALAASMVEAIDKEICGG